MTNSAYVEVWIESGDMNNFTANKPVKIHLQETPTRVKVLISPDRFQSLIQYSESSNESAIGKKLLKD